MSIMEDKPSITQLLKPTDTADGKVDNSINNYLKYYDGKDQFISTVEKRKEASVEIVNYYYDLATDFYEYGWGDAFHFATLQKGESREHAFAKHEYRLALKLGLKPGMKCLDVGCGVGGPARHIALFSRANITGLNCNNYQISRCELHTKNGGLENLCRFVQGDFNHMPFEDNTFDGVYAIEATCHAESKESVYGEIYRVLKPGAKFAFYEWIVTDVYDKNNKSHVKIKDDILEGDGLPDLEAAEDVLNALGKVGFKVLEAEDLASSSPVPWYSVLEGKWTLQDFKITPMGRSITHYMLIAMESIGLAPKGSVKVHRMLCKGADSLVKAGREGIFSPMFAVLAEKPNK